MDTIEGKNNNDMKKTFLSNFLAKNKAILFASLMAGSVITTTLPSCQSWEETIAQVDKRYDEDYNPEFKVRWHHYWDLYAWYLWYFTKTQNWIGFWKLYVWESLEITKTPNEIMKLLWQKKLQRKNIKWFTVAKKYYDDVVSKFDFNNAPKSTLEDYKNTIAESIEEIMNNFDFEKSASDYKKLNKNWTQEKQDLRVSLVKKIDANILVSYNCTEFFPKGNPPGKAEYWMLDLLLRTFGEDFINHIPAVADDFASFGPYQMTSLALYDTPQEKRGANIMNTYVSSWHKIPWSVTKLQWRDHHKAALLLAMFNLRAVVWKLSFSGVQTILSNISNNEFSSVIAQIIAIGHNRPADLTKAVQLLEQGKVNENFYEGMKTKNNNKMKTYDYAQKTRNNYKAQSHGVIFVEEPKIIVTSSLPSQNNTFSNKRSWPSLTIDADLKYSKSHFTFIKNSHDGKKEYTYIIQKWWTVGGVISVAKKSFSINSEIIVSDEKWKPYNADTYFYPWTKVVVKF